MEKSLLPYVWHTTAAVAVAVPALSPVRGARAMLGALLAAAGAALESVAQRLAQADARAAEREALAVREGVEALLEFHADAGAPEGALYVDGQLVGYLSGVSRL
jgi:hypothetical protein